MQLAKNGIGATRPNPSVGAVVVYQNEIIGEGFTSPYGGNHAEVNAINSVKNKALLSEATIYVTLEPCSHHGKTPPCTDLIIQHKIAKVVIGTKDQFFRVNGSGIEKLKEAGIDVLVNVLEEKSLELNKRFFTFHSEKRPYVILKWAQTSDGFIDIDRKEPLNIDSWITDLDAKVLVHHWRAEEQAIMVGTNTALNDNPKLTVREVDGNNPTRIVLDMSLRLPDNLNLFDGSVPTLVFNSVKNEVSNNLELIKIDAKGDIMDQILDELYYREIQSMIIEGGGQLINTFIYQNLWDEARVFTGNKEFKKGLPAPTIKKNPIFTLQIETDILNTYMNG